MMVICRTWGLITASLVNHLRPLYPGTGKCVATVNWIKCQQNCGKCLTELPDIFPSCHFALYEMLVLTMEFLELPILCVFSLPLC